MRRLREKIQLNNMRWQFKLRSYRKGRELVAVKDRTTAIRPKDILLFSTVRDEYSRLAYFLDYYRKMGVSHFLFADNMSSDGTSEFLAAQDDVSLWRARGSYKDARFGMDWLNYLLRRHGCAHWCLTVDPDEFLTYPHDDARNLHDLTDWLTSRNLRALSAMLLDMYGEGPIETAHVRSGSDPFDTLRWFDAGSYSYKPSSYYGNIWIQGGPRMRLMFADDPSSAPSLNKIPLVYWRWNYVYASSTHMLLPTRLNRSVWSRGAEEKPSGVLRHAKFVSALTQKAMEELERQQHFADSREYVAYLEGVGTVPKTNRSHEYEGWRQLERLGLISRGGWL